MKSSLKSNKFNFIGHNWLITVLSFVSFTPILLFYFLPSHSQPSPEEKGAPLPPSTQVPPAPEQPLPPPKTGERLNSSSLSTLNPPKPLSSPEKDKSDAKKPQSPTPPKAKTAVKPQAKPPQRKQRPRQKTITSAPNYTPPALDIKVAILRDAGSTTVGSSHGAVVSTRKGKVIRNFPANKGKLVQPVGQKLQIGKWTLPGVVFLKPAPGGFILVGDRWYRGRILLVSQGNSLLAVNWVNLEQYLYSVVGSEMHANAPHEALKAQAIAARSYALVHMIRPASSWYHLGNTQRWQVYKGINSEYNTGHRAVNETAGQILSYKGGVVESLYASTDEIVSRVHKGIGMSQIGAYGWARKGYNYQQILNHYYPGVSLARLTLKN